MAHQLCRPCLSADTITVISKMWNPREQYWMIAPESVIHELYGSHALYVSRLENRLQPLLL